MDPQNFTASETLKDGTPVTIRAILDDGNTILDAFKNLDRDSVYRRFFSPKKDLTAAQLKQRCRIGGRRARKGWRNFDWRRTLRAQSRNLAFAIETQGSNEDPRLLL